MDMENNNIKLSITDLPLEDRPREKMMLRGINALSSAELLAILIGSGNTDGNRCTIFNESGYNKYKDIRDIPNTYICRQKSFRFVLRL